jgi:hypothetical protein
MANPEMMQSMMGEMMKDSNHGCDDANDAARSMMSKRVHADQT